MGKSPINGITNGIWDISKSLIGKIIHKIWIYIYINWILDISWYFPASHVWWRPEPPEVRRHTQPLEALQATFENASTKGPYSGIIWDNNGIIMG
jgi:hypothetical protein